LGRNSKPIPVYLDRELRNSINRQAKEWHIPISSTIKVIVSKYLQNVNRKGDNEFDEQTSN